MVDTNIIKSDLFRVVESTSIDVLLTRQQIRCYRRAEMAILLKILVENKYGLISSRLRKGKHFVFLLANTLTLLSVIQMNSHFRCFSWKILWPEKHLFPFTKQVNFEHLRMRLLLCPLLLISWSLLSSCALLKALFGIEIWQLLLKKNTVLKYLINTICCNVQIKLIWLITFMIKNL